MARALFWLLTLFFTLLHLGDWRQSWNAEREFCRTHPQTLGAQTQLEKSGFRCRFPAQNPGVVQDGRGAFLRPMDRSAPEYSARLRRWMLQKFDQRLASWPGLKALAKAVWLGEIRDLPGRLSQLYQEAGLLHLLALSGQHVVSLWLLLRLGLLMASPFLTRSQCGRSLFILLGTGILPISAIYLALLNPDNEPMLRAASMILVAWCLRRRGFCVSGFQIAATTLAVSIVGNPAKVASDSFLLSAFATLLLCAWVGDAEAGNGLRAFIALTFAVPIMCLPIAAFFFGKVALHSALNGLLLGWAWGFVWVPLGFLLGVSVLPLPGGRMPAGLLEGVWQFFVAAHSLGEAWFGWGYFCVFRPGWVELLVGLWGCCALVYAVRRAVSQKKGGSFMK